MTDANTGLVKINKMQTKYEYSLLAFLDQLQSHVGVTATNCSVRSISEKRSQTKVTTTADFANRIVS